MPDDLSGVATEDLLAYKAGDLGKVSTKGLLAIKAARSARRPAAAAGGEQRQPAAPKPDDLSAFDDPATRAEFERQAQATFGGRGERAPAQSIGEFLSAGLRNPPGPVERTFGEPVRAAMEAGRDVEQKFGAMDAGHFSLGQVRDLVGSAGRAAGRGLAIPFAPVGRAVDALYPDPDAEAPATDALGKASQSFRGGMRRMVNSPVEAGHRIAYAPGVRQTEEALLGEHGPEAVASLMPFATGKLGSLAMRGVWAIDEGLTGARAPRMTTPNAVEGIPASPPMNRVVTAAEAARIIQERDMRGTRSGPVTEADLQARLRVGAKTPADVAKELGVPVRDVMRVKGIKPPRVAPVRATMAPVKSAMDLMDEIAPERPAVPERLPPEISSDLAEEAWRRKQGETDPFDPNAPHAVKPTKAEGDLDAVVMRMTELEQYGMPRKTAIKTALDEMESAERKDMAKEAEGRGMRVLRGGKDGDAAPPAAKPTDAHIDAALREAPGESPRGVAKRLGVSVKDVLRVKREGAAPEAAPSGDPFQGRPMGGEAGALRLPGMRPEPDTLPPGTPAERDAVAAIKQKIRYGPESTPGVGEKVVGGLKKLQSEFVRKEAPLARFEKSMTGRLSETGPTALAKFAQGSAARGAENVYRYGVLDTGAKVPAVHDALRDVVASGRPLSDVGAYAAARRVVESYDPNKIASGFDSAAAKTVVDLYERDHPAVVAAADAMHETSRALLRNLAEADRWKPKRLAAVEARNPFYVEFLRDFGQAENLGPTKTGGGSPIPGGKLKARTGGAQPIRDPLVGFQWNARKMIAMADQARVKHAFLDLVKADPKKASAYVEKVSRAKWRKVAPKFDDIMRAKNPATDPDLFNKTFEAYDEATKAGLIPVGSGGSTSLLRVKDPMLATALRGKDYEATHALTKLAGQVTAMQRLGITQFSPTFPLRNFVRDMGSYLAQAKEGNDVNLWTSLARGMYHSFRGSVEGVRLPRMLGGKEIPGTPMNDMYQRGRVEGFYNADTTKAAPLDLARMDEGLLRYYVKRPLKLLPRYEFATGEMRAGAPLGTALDVFKGVSSVVESAPRYAALMSSLERNGWRPGQSLTRDLLTKVSNDASEVTVNFRLGGDSGKFVNRVLFNFFNPAVQGLEQYRQTWAQRPALAGRRALTYGVAPAVALWWAWNKDERTRAAYDAMPEWRKAMMNVPMESEGGDVTALSLPVPQEAGAVHSATMAALDAWKHDDFARFLAVGREMMKRASPVDYPFVPDVVKGPYEAYFNEDTFTGRPVNPPQLEGGELVDPAAVQHPYNSSVAHGLAEFLHANAPKDARTPTTAEIDHMLFKQFGTAGKSMLQRSTTGEKEAADLPVVGTFFPRIRESKHVNDYYDLRKRLEGRVNLGRSATAKGDDAAAERYAVAPGTLAQAMKIDRWLKDAKADYDAAKESERPAIMRDMNEMAKDGIELLGEALR